MARERNKRTRALLPLTAGLYALLFLAALLFALDGRHVRFYLNGTAEMELSAGTAYSEPGCRAVSAGRLFGEGRHALPMTVSGQVDPLRPGDYVIDYAAQLLLRDYHARRTVHVVDRTPPVITLETRAGYAPRWLDGYEEEGFTALDAVDGDLTDRVERSVLGESVVYTVTDAAGNRSTMTRQIPYSEGLPRIEPIGGASLTIPAALHFDDPGVRAADARGFDYTPLLQTEGTVDPTRPGRWERVFYLDNRLGERVSLTQVIEVVPVPLPEERRPEAKTIYLTFDDGPGPCTAQLLDVLAEYGVKATFFVTNRYPDYFDMIGRAFREGHSIGVHSATHDYYTVYASEEAYYADFEACQALVFAQTGQHAEIFRFPGGSSNTVSSFNEGVMTRLTQSMNAMGYQYFDWNVDSDDAGRTHSTAGVLKNICDGCRGKDCCIVLQHDVKAYSVAAVRQVIEWGLEKGYVFAPLTPECPAAHHPLAN